MPLRAFVAVANFIADVSLRTNTIYTGGVTTDVRKVECLCAIRPSECYSERTRSKGGRDYCCFAFDCPHIYADFTRRVIEGHPNRTIRRNTSPRWGRTYEIRNWQGFFEDFIVSATTEK